MRNINAPTTWRGWVLRGQQLYGCGDYAGALAALQQSSADAPSSARPSILTRMVACQIQLNNTEAALALAQEIVELQPRWAPGHVTLGVTCTFARASNDACRHYQTALRMDSQHAVARKLLRHELQQRNDTTTSNNTTPTLPEDLTLERALGLDDDDASTEPSNDASSSHYSTAQAAPRGDSWLSRLLMWYHRLSEDQRTLLHIGLGLVVLYVAFGGRFGLSGNTTRRQGNYDASNNVYAQYRRQRHQEQQQHRGWGTPTQRTNMYSQDNSPRYHQSSSLGTGTLVLAVGIVGFGFVLPALVRGGYVHPALAEFLWFVLPFLLNGGRRRQGRWRRGGGAFGPPGWR